VIFEGHFGDLLTVCYFVCAAEHDLLAIAKFLVLFSYGRLPLPFPQDGSYSIVLQGKLVPQRHKTEMELPSTVLRPRCQSVARADVEDNDEVTWSVG